MIERPSVDEAMAALIAERLAGKEYVTVLFCEFCPKLWFARDPREHSIVGHYASWPCFEHYHKPNSPEYAYEGDKPKDIEVL